MCRSDRHKKQSGHQLGGGRRRGGVQAARQKARPDERPPIYRVVARGAINSRGFTAARKRAPLFSRAHPPHPPKFAVRAATFRALDPNPGPRTSRARNS